MSRYTTTHHVKKTYFTQSHNTLPSPHPKEEFISLIHLKKQYQSMIKQELDTLQAIQNAEIKELQNWQAQLENKAVQVEPFTISQPQREQEVLLQPKQEKMTGEVRSCFQQVRVKQLRKHTSHFLNILIKKRRSGVRKRASIYFYQYKLFQKYFRDWATETYPIKTQLQSLKVNNIYLTNFLRKPFFTTLSKIFSERCKRKCLQNSIQLQKRQVFFRCLANKTSVKYTRRTAEEQVSKILKKRGMRLFREHMSRQRAAGNINQKQRLIQNIYCHRRLNSFFNLYRKIKFRKQHSQITTSIINKIDLQQLVDKNQSKQPTLEQPIKNQERQTILGKPEERKVNTALLNLILQNFIEQYAQEYDCILDEKELNDFLFKLKTQCISKIISTYLKLKVYKNLLFNRKVSRLSEWRKYYIQKHLFKQLQVNKNIRQRKQALNVLLTQRYAQPFLMFLGQQKELKKQVNILEKSKIPQKVIQKQFFLCVRQYRVNKKIMAFKKDVAEQWRRSHLLSLVIKIFKEISNFQDQEDNQADFAKENEFRQKVFEDYYETEQQLLPQFRISKQQKEEDVSVSESQQQYYQNIKFSKAKHQLSKIVNVISKRVSNKQSADSNRKSTDSHQSNRQTATRLKTQSDHKEYVLEDEKPLQQGENIEIKRKQLAVFLIKGQIKRWFCSFKYNHQSRIYHQINKPSLNQKIQSLSIFSRQMVKAEFITLFMLQLNIKQKRRKICQLNQQHYQNQIKSLFLSLKFMNNLNGCKKQLEFKILQSAKRQFVLRMLSMKEEEQKMSELDGRIKQKKTQLLKYFFRSLKLYSNQSSQEINLKKVKFSLLSKRLLSNLKNLMSKKEQNQIRSSESQNPKKYQQFSQVDEEVVSNNASSQGQKEDSQSFCRLNQTFKGSMNEKQHASTPLEQKPNHLFDYISSEDPQRELASDSQHIVRYQGKKDEPSAQLSEQQYQSCQKQSQWLTNQLKINQIKIMIRRQDCLTFFRFLKGGPKTENRVLPQKQWSQVIEEEIEHQDLQVLSLKVKSLRMCNFIQKFLSFWEVREQKQIKQQQQAEIITFLSDKRTKRLTQKGFEGLFGLLEDKWGSKTKRVCFTGWLLFSKQKKLLRQYLKMQSVGSLNQVSFYPRTLPQKERFQQLQSF